MLGMGFVHGVIYCFLLGLVLQRICKKSGYGERVWFITHVGIAGAFVARFGDAIWWWQSWSWQCANFVYYVIGAAIAGAILAQFIKSPVNDGVAVLGAQPVIRTLFKSPAVQILLHRFSCAPRAHVTQHHRLLRWR